jgi:hypothetical protein
MPAGQGHALEQLGEQKALEQVFDGTGCRHGSVLTSRY